MYSFELAHPQISIFYKLLGVCKRATPADPKLQDLPHTGQPQDNWEDSHWQSSIDGVTEARNIEPDLGLIAINISCKGIWTEESTFGHTVTHYSFHNEMFSMLCFVHLYVWFLFRGDVAKVEDCNRGWDDNK